MSLDFRSAYGRLNLAQKEAVDNIEGPVMVIAGPGTGKTQLLSLRVANILSKTDSLPENILCLTFTDSAVSEMRDRLSTIIGQEAYDITVSTYHSFGSDLIRYYPAYFGNYADLKPLSDLSADSILRDIQSKLPYSNPYKNNFFLSDIKYLIRDSKQALLSPNDLKAVAESNLEFIEVMSKITQDLSDKLARVSKSSVADFSRLLKRASLKPVRLPASVELLSNVWDGELSQAIDESNTTGKNTSLSKWKLKFLAKDNDNNFVVAGREQNDRLVSFSEIYKSYLDELEEQGLYDFDDMILRSIEALENHPDFRFTIQEKYLYILLDEYQDTNQAQARLVALLSNNPVSEGRPNIMAVGDDDQAIYAFQGAKYSHMLDFVSSYKDVKLITLKENYRSSADIINLSSNVAGQIDNRLTTYLEGINKQFVTADASQDTSSRLTRLNFTSPIDEYAWIAENIKSKAKDKSYSDIAILAPKHKYLGDIVPYLQQLDIPIAYERRENILANPIIDQLISLCRLICAINDGNARLSDSLLSTVLGYEFWSLPSDIVWQISWKAYEDRKPWLKIILEQTETRQIGLFILKLAANSKSLAFDNILDQIIGLGEVSIYDTKNAAYNSPFYNYYKSGSTSSDIIISDIFSNLVTLREQFKGYKPDSTKPLLVADFIDFIQEVTLSELKIINSSPYKESDNSVQLMTAYKAKGQEFRSVYILSAVDDVWGSSSKSMSSKIGLPPNLQYIRYQTASDDEKLRLLYVALTRSKSEIYITSYSKNLIGKPSLSLKYLDESSTDESTISPFLPKANQLVKQSAPNSKDSANLIVSFQSGYKPLQIKTSLLELLKPRLENYQLSPTELNSFLDVRNAGPTNFYNRYILKYPSPVSVVVDYGSAVHESLDWLQRQLLGSSKLPSNRELIEQFSIKLKNKRLADEDYASLFERGDHCLTSYYAANQSIFSKDDISEYNFRNEGVFVGQAHLNGNIDKLIVDKPNGSLKIVDYKTGKSYKRWTSEAKLHLYMNQLYFYKLLIEKSTNFKKYRVSDAYLDFVEPDESGQLNKLSVEFSDGKMKRFEKLIEAVWDHIERLDFPDISKYPADLKGIRAFEDDLIDGVI